MLKTQADFVKCSSDNVPIVTELMIVNFFESNPNFISSETRGAKAERSARDSYGDNAIGYVQVKRDNHMCTVKAKVTPEHKLRGKPYTVTLVCDEKDRKVVSVECEGCAASAGGCKHCIAMLFWTHGRSSEPSTTETTNYWKKSTLSTIGSVSKFIYSTELGKSVKFTLPPRDTEVIRDFMNLERNDDDFQLKNCFSQIHTLSLHTLKVNFSAKYPVGTAKDFLNFLMFCIEEEDCVRAAEETVGQAQSPMWHELRYGRITASKIHEAAHCSTPDGSLVNSIYGSKFKATSAMKRGTILEPKVLKAIRKNHREKIEPCGLIISPECPVLGASPDGIASSFVVEVKCPSSDETVKNFYKDGKLTPKPLAQIQLQMRLCKKSKGLFVMASPDFEETGGIFEQWVEYDENLCSQNVDKALQFWCSNIFPGL